MKVMSSIISSRRLYRTLTIWGQRQYIDSLDLDLDNSRQEPEAITATTGSVKPDNKTVLIRKLHEDIY